MTGPGKGGGRVTEVMELCYVTERIIALWYKEDAQGVLEHATTLLRGKHADNYMVRSPIISASFFRRCAFLRNEEKEASLHIKIENCSLDNPRVVNMTRSSGRSRTDDIVTKYFERFRSDRQPFKANRDLDESRPDCSSSPKSLAIFSKGRTSWAYRSLICRRPADPASRTRGRSDGRRD